VSRTPHVDFLFDPDCPSHEEALARLHQVMAEEDVTVPVVVTALTSHEQAKAHRFPGSPTIRVDGIDIDDRDRGNRRYALTCRAYVKADGRISPLPPPELVRAALRRGAPTVERRALSPTPPGGPMPAISLGTEVPPFSLTAPATETVFATEDLGQGKPFVVGFTSNHCPHAQAYEGRLLAVARDYSDRADIVLVSSSDPEQAPEDGPDAIAERAREREYPVPYLFDADQSVAATFGASRTPHVFVFDSQHGLAYHGTVDDNEEDPDAVRVHYLRDAVDAVVNARPVPIPETEVIGCTIKWKAAAAPTTT
jgi:thiol-disulfide isomerase/thioredoxin